MTRITMAARLLVLAAALTALVAPGTAVRAAGAQQVVFSLAVSPEPVGTFGPYGYWIWCEDSATNPYGNNCAGSIYFYAIQLAPESVDGTITEIAQGQYQMVVHTANGWSCTLTNTPPVLSGPHNTVTTNCTNPSGSGTATNATVIVTR